VVSPDTYRLVGERLEELGLDHEGFSKMRPWMLAVTLTGFELTRAGYSQAEGVDVHLFERARADGKEVIALETVEFQVGLFTGMPEGISEAFLRHTLDELDSVIPQVDEIIDFWQAGDVDKVEGLLGEAYAEYPDLFRRLVSDRNRTWLPRLEALLAGERPAMAVIGALHLVGEQGVVELLLRAGYAVEQL